MRKIGLGLVLMGAAWFVHGGCSSEDGSEPPKLGSDAAAGSGGTPAGGSAGSSGALGSAGRGGSSGGSGGNPSGGTGGVGRGGSAGSGGSGTGGAGTGGAGTGGAGTGGASGTSGTGGSGGQTDPCLSARFCETFESYAVGSPPAGDWRQRTNHGAVTVSQDQKFGGAKSARFTTEANSGGKTAFIRVEAAAIFPVPGNVYFGRMMFRLESAPETAVHWTFIQSTGLIPGQSYRATYRYGGQHPVTEGNTFIGNQLMANYDTPDSYSGNGPSSDCWHHANEKVVPTGRWACAEWQFDGPNNAMKFWLDGQPISDLTVTGRGQGCVHQAASFTWTAPSFQNLEIGWESYQNDGARTLYIDDVVISTQQVGCPAAP